LKKGLKSLFGSKEEEIPRKQGNHYLMWGKKKRKNAIVTIGDMKNKGSVRNIKNKIQSLRKADKKIRKATRLDWRLLTCYNRERRRRNSDSAARLPTG